MQHFYLVKEALEVALKHHVIFPMTLVEYGKLHGDDSEAIINDLVNTAHICRHYNVEGMKAVYEVTNRYYAAKKQSIEN